MLFKNKNDFYLNHCKQKFLECLDIGRWARWNSKCKSDRRLQLILSECWIYIIEKICPNLLWTNEYTTKRRNIMEENPTSTNPGTDSSVSVGVSNKKLSAAPTASPEEFSEHEYVIYNQDKDHNKVHP